MIRVELNIEWSFFGDMLWEVGGPCSVGSCKSFPIAGVSLLFKEQERGERELRICFISFILQHNNLLLLMTTWMWKKMEMTLLWHCSVPHYCTRKKWLLGILGEWFHPTLVVIVAETGRCIAGSRSFGLDCPGFILTVTAVTKFSCEPQLPCLYQGVM